MLLLNILTSKSFPPGEEAGKHDTGVTPSTRLWTPEPPVRPDPEGRGRARAAVVAPTKRLALVPNRGSLHSYWTEVTGANCPQTEEECFVDPEEDVSKRQSSDSTTAGTQTG